MSLFAKSDLLRLAGHERMDRGAALVDTINDLYEDEWSLVGTVCDGDATHVAMIHWDGIECECDCPDGRARVFCEHAVAVGLCYLGEDEPDPGDGCLGELASLWGAKTVDELHRALVLRPTLRSSADAFEPEALFVAHHRAQPDNAVSTALLLLTDVRWQQAAGRLVRRIEATEIVEPEDLDQLAESFLRADRCLFWELPDRWFGAASGSIDIEFGAELEAGDAGPGGVGEVLDDEDFDDEPAVVARVVAPPLRRWAAARLVRRDPGGWERIWRDAESIEARGAAAIKCGVLDAIDSIPYDVHDDLIDSAVLWPHHSVRQISYALVVAQRGPSAAHQLAQHDPNAKLRSWARTLLEPAATQSRAPQFENESRGKGPRRSPQPEQDSLF